MSRPKSYSMARRITSMKNPKYPIGNRTSRPSSTSTYGQKIQIFVTWILVLLLFLIAHPTEYSHHFIWNRHKRNVSLRFIHSYSLHMGTNRCHVMVKVFSVKFLKYSALIYVANIKGNVLTRVARNIDTARKHAIRSLFCNHLLSVLHH